MPRDESLTGVTTANDDSSNVGLYELPHRRVAVTRRRSQRQPGPSRRALNSFALR